MLGGGVQRFVLVVVVSSEAGVVKGSGVNSHKHLLEHDVSFEIHTL